MTAQDLQKSFKVLVLGGVFCAVFVAVRQASGDCQSKYKTTMCLCYLKIASNLPWLRNWELIHPWEFVCDVIMEVSTCK